ncbi:MAG TPA: ferritin-like domain-containing protein [Verrucomicrobiae bacterium]|nr:ferritin-like domain-containing protein [Verrucomicrobiae bacterium]
MPKKTQSTGKRFNTGEEPEDNRNNDLQELFLDELADVYSAEQQLIKALPKVAKNADSDELREAVEEHLEQTKEHAKRLEEVARGLDQSIKRKTCAAMKGLVEEANEVMREQKGSSALDAAIIAGAQKIEHYEIASYGTLIAWANQLGYSEQVEELQQTLEEEKETDEKLTSLAEEMANQRAQAE